MNVNTIVLIVAGVAGVMTKISESENSRTIATNIRSTARSQASKNPSWSDEVSLSMKRNKALELMRRFEAKEKARVELAFNSDKAAKDAVKEFNKLNRQYEEAKKAIDNFKPSSVDVSVGSGENSASVKISDESAKTTLESKLADISAKRADAKETVDAFRKSIAESIIDERPIEHTEAIENFNKLDADYNLAKNANDKSVYALLKDDEWVHKEFVKEFQKTHSEFGIVTKGCLYSALPVAALVLIWKGTFKELALLKEVV